MWQTLMLLKIGLVNFKFFAAEMVHRNKDYTNFVCEWDIFVCEFARVRVRISFLREISCAHHIFFACEKTQNCDT